jgi:hypothetical protein
MLLLRKTKTKRYSVELPIEIIKEVKEHLKDVFANKTNWFVRAIKEQIKSDKNKLEK